MLKKPPYPRKNNSLGFTLVEMLVVVSVIGVLAGVTLVLVNRGATNAIASDTAQRSKIADLAQAIEAFRLTEGSYPVDLNDATLLEVYVGNMPTTADIPGLTYNRISATQFVLGAPRPSEVVQLLGAGTMPFIVYFSANGRTMQCPTLSTTPTGCI